MNLSAKTRYYLMLLSCVLLKNGADAQELNGFVYGGNNYPGSNIVENYFQFNGYTNYWHDTRETWVTYGNLFKIAFPDVAYTIAQSKADIADDLEIPGLSLQEGFLYNLFRDNYEFLDQPSLQSIEEAAAVSNVLVSADPSTGTGKKLASLFREDHSLKENLKSHQMNAADYIPVNAFMLEKGPRKIFVILSASPALNTKALRLIRSTGDILEKYDLQRGWFGAETLLKSVTCTAGHPLEVIGKGMNEGNTWFTFSGYMDFLALDEIKQWITRSGLPITVDAGTAIGYTPSRYRQAIYGCNDYSGLQVQDTYTTEAWLKFAHDREGYAFRSPYDPEADMYHFDGYIAGEGNKEQVDNENIPFVTTTGPLDQDAVPCMVLFTPKGEKLTRESMWKSIMERREVAVTGKGMMMGPQIFRNSLGLLLLDRVYLDEYFGSRISLEAYTNNYQLVVNLTNTLDRPVAGNIEIVLPDEISISGSEETAVSLPANTSRELHFELQPGKNAMGRTNPIAVHFRWKTGKKSTLTMLDLPPVISANQLLYGIAPSVVFPVTVHNYTESISFPVSVEVMQKDKPSNVVFSKTITCDAEKGTFRDMSFNLEIPPGSYNVKISALGTAAFCQMGAGHKEGSAVLKTTDIDGDGVDEYVMENDSVRITLLATGGRIIEYFIKSRNDNALYKKWPGKPVDDKRAYRKRGYYPYGGFEDFLGQASMETHKVYDAEIIKREGDYVRLKMTADYFGNRLEKTYTLYGNSPLVEVRFAITFKNPEANMIAPVPVLELGARHWTEDVFMVPTANGTAEYRMKPERYYGQIFFPSEGWDAGYDTREDISFVSAFPVTPPIFLHMFMNHPSNPDAHFYCHEFQPWVPLKQKTTTYFTFYMWGAGGDWHNGVKELRKRNLITERQ